MAKATTGYTLAGKRVFRPASFKTQDGSTGQAPGDTPRLEDGLRSELTADDVASGSPRSATSYARAPTALDAHNVRRAFRKVVKKSDLVYRHQLRPVVEPKRWTRSSADRRTTSSVGALSPQQTCPG